MSELDKLFGSNPVKHLNDIMKEAGINTNEAEKPNKHMIYSDAVDAFAKGFITEEELLELYSLTYNEFFTYHHN